MHPSLEQSQRRCVYAILGIGSESHGAVELGVVGIGIELKPSILGSSKESGRAERKAKMTCFRHWSKYKPNPIWLGKRLAGWRITPRILEHNYHEKPKYKAGDVVHVCWMAMRYS